MAPSMNPSDACEETWSERLPLIEGDKDVG
jgi:hypothetical protein